MVSARSFVDHLLENHGVAFVESLFRQAIQTALFKKFSINSLLLIAQGIICAREPVNVDSSTGNELKKALLQYPSVVDSKSRSTFRESTSMTKFNPSQATSGVIVSDDCLSISRSTSSARCFALGMKAMTHGTHRWAIRIMCEKKGLPMRQSR
jgi:hypothetical protein